eukprot:m.644460 g.644460  ORF g.644460 m.644460 type:complete len:193 (+) comp58352_c0_seq20:1587-2165(+)
MATRTHTHPPTSCEDEVLAWALARGWNLVSEASTATHFALHNAHTSFSLDVSSFPWTIWSEHPPALECLVQLVGQMDDVIEIPQALDLAQKALSGLQKPKPALSSAVPREAPLPATSLTQMLPAFPAGVSSLPAAEAESSSASSARSAGFDDDGWLAASKQFTGDGSNAGTIRLAKGETPACLVRSVLILEK